MRQELLKAMTWQDLVEIVEETESVFDDEIYDGKNPNETFTTPESYYKEVMRRLRDKYKSVMPIVERYPVVLEAAQQATGTILSNSRSRENTFVRCLVAHKLHTEGYSYHEIGKMMKRDHSTITHLFFNMADMLSVPEAYKEEIERYREFIELCESASLT